MMFRAESLCVVNLDGVCYCLVDGRLATTGKPLAALAMWMARQWPSWSLSSLYAVMTLDPGTHDWRVAALASNRLGPGEARLDFADAMAYLKNHTDPTFYPEGYAP